MPIEGNHRVREQRARDNRLTLETPLFGMIVVVIRLAMHIDPTERADRGKQQSISHAVRAPR